jgi:hypothetical protein
MFWCIEIGLIEKAKRYFFRLILKVIETRCLKIPFPIVLRPLTLLLVFTQPAIAQIVPDSTTPTTLKIQDSLTRIQACYRSYTLRRNVFGTLCVL